MAHKQYRHIKKLFNSMKFYSRFSLKALLIMLCWQMSVLGVNAFESASESTTEPVSEITEVPNAQKFRLDLINSLQMTFQSKQFTLADARVLSEGEWSPMSEEGASLGYKLNKTLWLKTQLKIETERELYLLFDYAILDEISVYVKPTQVEDFSYLQTGDLTAFAQRPIKHRKSVIPIYFVAGSHDIFIRVNTSTSYTVPVILMDPATFYESETLKNTFLAALFGGAIYMILLNLFGGFRLRNPGYLYYVAFAGSSLLFNFTIHGYGRFYLWQSLPQITDTMMMLFSAVGGLSYALFLTAFLPLKKYYRLDYRICFSHAIMCGLSVVLFLIGFTTEVQIFTHMINSFFALYSMVLAWRVWRGGSTNAFYLFLGWLCLMSSVVVKAMVAMGLVAYNDIYYHMFDLGMTLNFAFISMGLASKIVEIQEKEIVARKEAVMAKSLAILNMEHYRALFEYAPIPMFKVNQSDQFVAANRAFIQLFGFDSEKALIRSQVKSKDTYCIEKDYMLLLSDLRRRGEADLETLIRVKSGREHWVRLTVRAIDENGYTIFEGACIDVTSQVERQEYEKAAHKREVNQLEALVAGVAHYLNSPLGSVNTAQSVVSGKTREVESDLSEQKLTAARLRNFLDVIQESGNVIKNSVEKSIHVVERFKELNSEENQISFSSVTSAELLKSLKVSLKSEVKNNINIVFDDTSSKNRLLPLNQLLIVLKKLVHNAYTHGKADEVYIALTETESGLNIVFKDNGKGLAEDVNAEDLFAPFFAKNLSYTEVSGLDLFVVKTIVQNRLEGQVNIDQNALPAMVFNISLPDFTELDLNSAR